MDEAGLNTLPQLAANHVPLSPVSFLCHQKWDSASKLTRIPLTTPILMLSGSRDEIVPPAHIQELERLLREVPGKGRRPGRIAEFATGAHSEYTDI